jgi:hypothetical protein
MILIHFFSRHYIISKRPPRAAVESSTVLHLVGFGSRFGSAFGSTSSSAFNAAFGSLSSPSVMAFSSHHIYSSCTRAVEKLSNARADDLH